MKEVKRNKFRAVYQPSKLLLGIIPDEELKRPNIIALCFTMTCSYSPPMIAVSIEKKNYSYELIKSARDIVLAVPGEALAEKSMECGILSGRNIDKFNHCNFTHQAIPNTVVPGISEAIANISLSIVNRVITGDHLTVIGLISGYYINRENIEKNLLAIGPNDHGYKLLVRRGLHRIAVVDGAISDFNKGFDLGKIFS